MKLTLLETAAEGEQVLPKMKLLTVLENDLVLCSPHVCGERKAEKLRHYQIQIKMQPFLRRGKEDLGVETKNRSVLYLLSSLHDMNIELTASKGFKGRNRRSGDAKHRAAAERECRR